MRFRALTAVSVLTLALAGCQTSATPSPEAVKPPETAQLRADVNPDYKAGQVIGKTDPTDNLDQILAKTRRAPERSKEEDQEDKLRLPALKEAASSYGAKAGLAYATREINRRLEAKSAELTKTYDFHRLMIQGPNNVMVQPPIIVEARDAWEATDAGKTLRVADKVYEIIDNAKFTPVSPMWQTYLMVNFEPAEEPPEQLRPRNDDEEKMWRTAASEGWKLGEQQAEETFQANLDRLNRDFTGMVRYRKMLEECKVVAPQVVDGNLGTTGTGQNMRENDRLNRITQDALLNVTSKCWNASVTTKSASDEVVGVAANQTNVAPKVEEKPRTAQQNHKQRPKKVSAKNPSSTAQTVNNSTSSGKGRF